MPQSTNVVNIRPINSDASRQLIESVPPTIDGELCYREKLIEAVPFILKGCLELTLMEFDIKAFPEDNTAVVCRMLALIVARLKEAQTAGYPKEIDEVLS